MAEAGLIGESTTIPGTGVWRVGESQPGFLIDWSKVVREAVPAKFQREASLGLKVIITPDELIAVVRQLATSILEPRRGLVAKLRARCDEARTLHAHFLAIHTRGITDLIEVWESWVGDRRIALPDASYFTAADQRVKDVEEMAAEVKAKFDANDSDVQTVAGAQREHEKLRWRIEEAQWALEGRTSPRTKGALSEMNAYLHAMTDEGRGGADIIAALDFTKTGCWAVFTVAGGAVYGTAAGATLVLGAAGGLMDAAAGELGRDANFTNWDRDAWLRILWNTVVSAVTNLGGGWAVEKFGQSLVGPLSKKIVASVGTVKLGCLTIEAAEAHVKKVLEDGFGNALGGLVSDLATAVKTGECPNPSDLLKHIIANFIGGGLASRLNKVHADKIQADLLRDFPPSEWLSKWKVRTWATGSVTAQ